MFSGPGHVHSVVWKEKKVCLVNCVWRGHIEFGARNVFLHRKINLPKGLAYQPFFASFSETFAVAANFLIPVALRAVVKFRKFLIHPILIYGSKFDCLLRNDSFI